MPLHNYQPSPAIRMISQESNSLFVEVRRTIENRILESIIYDLAQRFPIVAISGPRQSGKKDLSNKLFENKSYISLNEKSVRQEITKNPGQYLQQFMNGVIIDDAHLMPDFYRYIASHVDHTQKMGEIILISSQNLSTNLQIKKHLGERVTSLQLLTCSLMELQQIKQIELKETLFKGCFPSLHNKDLDPTIYFNNYVKEYLEIDLVRLSKIKETIGFRRFLSTCAERLGQPINFSAISEDCGVSFETIKSWFSICEQNFIVFLIPPCSKNDDKRAVKQPKLYFYDTGLAAYLLGIRSEKEIFIHENYKAMFENFIVLEIMKKGLNAGATTTICFWRDYKGNEVSFVVDCGTHIDTIGIETGDLFTSNHINNDDFWKNVKTQNMKLHLIKNYIIADKEPINSPKNLSNFQFVSWRMAGLHIINS